MSVTIKDNFGSIDREIIGCENSASIRMLVAELTGGLVAWGSAVKVEQKPPATRQWVIWIENDIERVNNAESLERNML